MFSKYLHAVSLKSKKSMEIVTAFKEIFKEHYPLKIKSDQGLEFNNIQFKKLCEKFNIRYFTSHDKKIKCSIVERVNRTLKNKMFKYFTGNGTKKYIDVLPKLVKSINNSYHRSIKMSPSEVNESNESLVYENLYGDKKLKNIFLNKVKYKGRKYSENII